MSSTLIVDLINPVPLDLTVEREGVGGVTGLVPTVAIRKTTTLNSYLDFADNTFKTAGWTTKFAPLSEVERGHYQRTILLGPLGLTVGSVLAAEYHVNNGAGIIGDDLDLLVVTGASTLVPNIDLLRKALTNRMEETSGSPGLLKLYDDDGVTVIKTWEIRDEFGGPIAPGANTPARRSAAT